MVAVFVESKASKRKLVLLTCGRPSPFRSQAIAANSASPQPEAIEPNHESTITVNVDDDSKPLLPSATTALDVSDPDALFSKTLDRELDRIVKFYKRKEGELLKELAVVLADLAHEERINELSVPGTKPSARGGAPHAFTDDVIPAPTIGAGDITPMRRASTADASSPSLEKPSTSQQPFHRARSDESSDDEPVRTPARRKTQGDIENRRASIVSVWDLPGAKHTRTQFRQRLINLFVLFVELKDFADLNYTGFRKALKKYDKVIGRHLQKAYMKEVVDPEYPWLAATRSEIEDAIDRVTLAYARITTDGNKNMANMELRANLREHIVWERNTVWRDMIEQERRQASVKLKAKNLDVEEGGGETVWYIPFCGAVRVPSISRGMWVGLLAFITFVVLLAVPIFPTVEQENCFAILVLASLLWATEVSFANGSFLSCTSWTDLIPSPRLPRSCPSLSLRFSFLSWSSFLECSGSPTLDFVWMPKTPRKKYFPTCFPPSSCFCSVVSPWLRP